MLSRAERSVGELERDLLIIIMCPVSKNNAQLSCISNHSSEFSISYSLHRSQQFKIFW